MRLLVVDDSAVTRAMIKRTVAAAGLPVVAVDEASDGQAAIRALALRGADLLITDLNMPGMNGIEFIREVRKLPNYRFMPILFLTTESQQSKKLEAKAAGATGWIVKPFKPDQLLAVAKKLLR